MVSRLAAVCLVAMMVFGCGGGGQDWTYRIERGDEGPSFALSDIITGESINSAKMVQSHHATVITLWSMACPSCKEALLEVQRAHEDYSSKLIAFVGVNFDVENIQGVRAFVQGSGIGFPVLSDRTGRVTRSYRALDYTFSIFVLDRNGTVILTQYDHPPDLYDILAETLDDVLEPIIGGES
jgi:peroxiredoxin